MYPNNDPGSDAIIAEYDRLGDDHRFRIFPSLRFEAFLVLLHHARMLIGNSSAGIREAPIYGVPSVDVGDRQRGRHDHASIHHAGTTVAEISAAIAAADAAGRTERSLHFGRGDSALRFAALLADGEIWALGDDKVFRDVSFADD